MKRRTRFLVAMVMIAVIAGASAFGEEQKVDPKLDPWLKSAQLGPYTPAKEDWNQVVAKAKAEGKVVVYSSTSRTRTLKDLFEKTYPGVTLEVYDVETLQIHEKFNREYSSGVYNVDILFNDATFQMYEFWQKGMIFRYVPARVADKVPDYFKSWLLKQRYGPGLVVFYNPAYWTSKPPVTNLWDFTKEEWKGKIAIADPTQHGGTLTGITLLTYPDNAAALAKSYEKAYGKPIDLKGFANAGYLYLSMIAKNKAIIVKSDDNVMELVGAKGQAGMPPFGLFVTMSKLRQITEKGLNLATLAPGFLEPFEEIGQPPSSDLSGAVAGIAANAQHPYASKLLIDFLMGDEKGEAGFAPWHVIGNWSTRTDVPAAKGDIQDRSLLRSMPGKPDTKWMAENQPKVRDFWMTQVF
jgi:iron(III) transport system substrate-binding protein